MSRRPFTPFGIAVRSSLLKSGRTQEWLIQECKNKTGLFIDSSVMSKLMTGQRNSKRLKQAIVEILNLSKKIS